MLMFIRFPVITVERQCVVQNNSKKRSVLRSLLFSLRIQSGTGIIKI